MNKKQRRLKSKLRLEEQRARATINRYETLMRESEHTLTAWKNRVRDMQHHASHAIERADQELARFKFIDDILRKMAADSTFSSMPLFQYMRGERHSGVMDNPVPDGWTRQYPPLFRHAYLPEVSWKAQINNNFTHPAEAMVMQALEYYLFDFYERRDSERKASVLTYDFKGQRRSYMLPAEVAALPEAEAIAVVIRELTPGVLALIRGARL